MARNEKYTQCTMERPVKGGVTRMVSWIPTPMAKLHTVVRLKEGPL